MKEFRIFGPPGTGKTTRLATRDIPRAVEKYGSEGVMVTSFTKAAAKEISQKKSKETGKAIAVARENVGTMHSILYHALGQPAITEVHFIDEWNEKNPRYRIVGGKVQSMDEACTSMGSTQTGDKLLNSINIKRNRLISVTKWTSKLKKFYERWSQFKQETDSMDFTDIIEAGLYEFDKAPNNPDVIFVDEAQDFSHLQLACIRSWGKHTDWIILVGDDDQTIFEFTGADPTAFLNPPIPQNHKTVLKRSYRVPQSVLTRANKLIRKIRNREPKDYSPRFRNPKDESQGEAIGKVRDISETYKNADSLLEKIQLYTDKGMSIMFLASCSYMLEPIKEAMREKSIPFHNQYRRRRRDWNPLHHQSILVDFLDEGIDEKFWNVPQFVSWAKHLQVGDGTSGLIRKIGKKGLSRLKDAIKDNEPGLHTCRDVLEILLTPNAVTNALDRNIEWYMDNI
jgi:superfamily I DNA/RNA helicase